MVRLLQKYIFKKYELILIIAYNGHRDLSKRGGLSELGMGDPREL